MKAKTIYTFLTRVLVCLSAISGCDMHGVEFYPEDEDELKRITISDVKMDRETRAATLDSTTFSDFGFYAGLSLSGHFDKHTAGTDYMKNAMVTKNWTTGNWNTSASYYWPAMENWTISFFPYAPYISDTAILKLSPSYTTGEPVILYRPASDPRKQKDLCVSPALYDKTSSDSPLTLNFYHALCYVQFWANYRAGSSGLPAGHHIKVDRLTLHDIIGMKGLTWKRESPGYGWTADSGDDSLGDYSLSRTGEDILDSQLPPVPGTIHLDCARGALLLLPQTINEPSRSWRSTLEVDFSIFRTEGSTEVHLSSFNVVKELPSGTEWMASGIVRYTFTIDVENLSLVEITTSTSAWTDDWKDSGNQGPDETIEK